MEQAIYTEERDFRKGNKRAENGEWYSEKDAYILQQQS